MEWLSRSGAGVLALGLAACGGQDAAVPGPSATAFVFAMRGVPEAEGRFVAVTDDPAVLARLEDQLALPESERSLHIAGPIASGNGGHNLAWSWHFIPGRWDVVEASIEVCDGTPQAVEKDVGRWVAEVGTFCPWASYVQRRM